MKTVFEHIRYHLLTQAKVIKRDPVAEYNDLVKTEWSPLFERMMRQRLLMGALRYGRMHAAGKPKYDRIASITKLLNLYTETGNKEHLVDCANMLLLEFEECYHPKAHIKALDETGGCPIKPNI